MGTTRPMVPGDIYKVEVQGVGVLRNRVVQGELKQVPKKHNKKRGRSLIFCPFLLSSVTTEVVP